MTTIVHKDIALLTQKGSVAGTEKIPVSDTEYVTTSQIAGQVSVPTISTNVATDKADNTKTAGAKAVYDEVHPATQSSIPNGGLLPNIEYKLGTLTGSVSIDLASPSDSSVSNEYNFEFDVKSSVPTVSWDSSILSWAGKPLDSNGQPSLSLAGTGYYHHYEFSVKNGMGIVAKFTVAESNE